MSRSPPSPADPVFTRQPFGPAVDGEAAELAILRLLQSNPALSQRDVSKALGLSLGKTHYLLRALMEKGSIKVRNFQRSDNKVAYMYLLTPNGVRKRVALTRAFLQRKESEFIALQQTISRLRSELNRPDSE
jgi:EPS-associated MarR family transcriptional regulator